MSDTYRELATGDIVVIDYWLNDKSVYITYPNGDKIGIRFIWELSPTPKREVH